MKISEEMLMAYADGQLSGTDHDAVEAAMRTDPEVAAAVARQQRLRARLAEVFDPVLSEPVPDRLSALLHAEPSIRDDVIDLDAARSRRAVAPTRLRSWQWPAAMAASLVLGVLLSQAWLSRTEPALVMSADGALLARGELADGLDRQLASAPTTGSIVTVGLSFRSKSNGICRTFVLHRSADVAGLACRTNAGWSLPVVAAMAKAHGDGMQPAASDMPAAVLAEVDARIEGDPLDAQTERSARDSGWH